MCHQGGGVCRVLSHQPDNRRFIHYLLQYLIQWNLSYTWAPESHTASVTNPKWKKGQWSAPVLTLACILFNQCCRSTPDIRWCEQLPSHHGHQHLLSQLLSRWQTDVCPVHCGQKACWQTCLQAFADLISSSIWPFRFFLPGTPGKHVRFGEVWERGGEVGSTAGEAPLSSGETWPVHMKYVCYAGGVWICMLLLCYEFYFSVHYDQFSY